MSVGNRLREALKMRDMSIRAFQAEMKQRDVSGASYPTIHRYLKDETSPTLNFLHSAAAVLDVRAAWLATGEGTATDRIDAERVIRQLAARHFGLPEKDQKSPGVKISADEKAVALAGGFQLGRYLDELGDRIAQATLQTPFADLVYEVDVCFRSFIARYFSTRDKDDLWTRWPDMGEDDRGRALPSVEQIREFIYDHFKAAPISRNYGYGEFAASVLAQLSVLYLNFFGRGASIVVGTSPNEPDAPIPRA